MISDFYSKYGKRIFDLFVVILSMPFWLTIIGLIALLVRVKIGKPLFFRQNRAGKNGKIFEIVKFRSMTDARDSKNELLPDKQRLLPFGKFLRESSLDELPGLFQVLSGKMSLVGPRPLLPEYLNLYNETQNRRHEVAPGITGLAQINGRNAISWDQKFKLDVNYVDSQSLLGDIKILLLTVKKVLKKDDINASQEEPMVRFTGNGNNKR